MGLNEEEINDGSRPTHSKMTFTLIWTILAAAIGSGFQHGYNTGILNAPQKVIESWMNETMAVDDTELTVIWSTTTSIMSIGGIIGGALTSVASTSLGRRKALILNNLIAIVAGVLMGSAKYASQPSMLIVGRFIVGINAGLNGGVAPMYLSEISPMRLRGAIGVVYQVSMTASILISEIVGNGAILGTMDLWPFLLFLILIPAIYQMIALLFSPESPKYLLEINEEVKAMSECIRLCGEKEGRENLERIKNEIADARSQPDVTLKDMCVIRKYRRPLIIMCLLHAAQQLSGVNVVVYYSTQIFRSAHLSEEHAQLATIGVGLINMLTTFVSVFLVEICGRKPLLTIGFGGMAVALSLLMGCLSYVDKYPVMAYAAVLIVYLFKIVFAIGPGPIPWLIGSELFTTSVRPLGLSVAVPVNWLFNFVVGLAYLPLQTVMGAWVFSIFIIFMAIATVYFFFAIPETKNRPIDEITAQFE
uniref:Solute carrier family 2, facilitated glucose transporter member 1 n=1 Tax=Lygus hesperus TaxID=30085 RepID=A0A0A9XMB1_LYGHE